MVLDHSRLGQKTSVGIVFDKDEFTKSDGTPQDILQRWIESTPPVKKRMKDARLVGAIQTTSDFSYHNRRLVGPRLLRVGDAAGFMDPIFSAGVYLASWSGKLAAEVVIKCLDTGKPSAPLFDRYEKRVRKGLRFYWRVVEEYYTTSFMEIFLRPGNHYDLPSAVNAVLAGELEGGCPCAGGLEYFFSCQNPAPFQNGASHLFWPAPPAQAQPPAPSGKSLNFKPHKTAIAAIFALAFLLCVSCRTSQTLPPADFSSPGWHLRQGQAVWKPPRKRPELAGDLLLATNDNGNYMIQFSKIPFTLAMAQVENGAWQIKFGNSHYAGGRANRPRGFPGSNFPELLANPPRNLRGSSPAIPTTRGCWSIREPAKPWRAYSFREALVVGYSPDPHGAGCGPASL